MMSGGWDQTKDSLVTWSDGYVTYAWVAEEE